MPHTIPNAPSISNEKLLISKLKNQDHPDKAGDAADEHIVIDRRSAEYWSVDYIHRQHCRKDTGGKTTGDMALRHRKQEIIEPEKSGGISLG